MKLTRKTSFHEILCFQYIRSVLEEYGADETGKADFALQANGSLTRKGENFFASKRFWFCFR